MMTWDDARLENPMSDARLREIRRGIEFNQMGMDEDEAQLREAAEAAYASYEDDLFDEPHSEECCCEDCLQDYPERDALYNDCQFYGEPSDGTVAMLCSYPGCEAIAEIIPDGEPIPAGSIGRKHLFCPKHASSAARSDHPAG